MQQGEHGRQGMGQQQGRHTGHPVPPNPPKP